MYNIKERLNGLGKSQVWLLRQLRGRGFTIQPPQLSNIINEVYTYPKARSVLDECNSILLYYEKIAGTK